MECAENLTVQAYFDGEVDAATAAAVERHLATCEQCRVLLEDLGQIRTLMRDKVAKTSMPEQLRDRIMECLDEESRTLLRPPGRNSAPPRRSRPFWVGLFSGVGGSAVAAAVTLLVLAPLRNHTLTADLIADHTQSLLSSHLIEVVSTDQHTVKPWFAGRTNVSPEVADFSQQGYRLLGGRVDDLDHHKAAVMVYRHGPHYINVFSWASDSTALPQDTTRNGYHLAFWKVGNLAYCAVSDTGWTELKGLVSLLEDQSARDLPQ
ncbi:MAG TPA: anti-sigma factor [Steroidobacteraceae bacterium]|jgi:anti-sigma factor RsiW